MGRWGGTWLQNGGIWPAQGMVTLWYSSQPLSLHGGTDVPNLSTQDEDICKVLGSSQRACHIQGCSTRHLNHTVFSSPQTTVVAEAEAAVTATVQAGHPTTQGHMGATEEVLGAAPPIKANKVGLKLQVTAWRGGPRATQRGMS